MGIEKFLMIKVLGDGSSGVAMYRDVTKEGEKFAKETEKHGFSMKQLGTTMVAVGGVVVGAFTAIVLETAKYSRELEHNAQVAGVGIETLERYTAAGKKVDVTQEEIVLGLDKLAKMMDKARTGTGAQAEAFHKMGINVQNADGTLRKNSDVLLEIATHFHAMTNETEKAALAQVVFGKSGAQLLPMLNLGAEGIEKFGDAAEKMGGILSDKSVEALANLDKKLQAAQGGIANFGKEIAVSLEPYVSKLVDGLLWLVQQFRAIPEPIQQATIMAIAAAGAISLIGGACILAAPAIIAALTPLLPFIAAGAGLAILGTVIYNNWIPIAAFFESDWKQAVAIAQIAFSAFKIAVLSEIWILLKAFESLTSWIPSFGDKVKQAGKTVENMISKEATEINKNRITAVTSSYEQNLKRMQDQQKKHTQNQTKEIASETEEEKQIRLKAQDDMFKKHQEFNAKILEEYKKAAADNLKINKDKLAAEIEENNDAMKKELAAAAKVGGDKTEIYRLYAEKEKKIRADYAKQTEDANKSNNKRLEDQQIQYYTKIANDEKKSESDRLAARKKADALKIAQLEKEKNDELKKAAELGTDKQAIIDYYANAEQQVYDETAQAHKTSYDLMNQDFRSYAGELASGSKTIGEIGKEMIIKQLTGLEQSSLAIALKGILDAVAMAPSTFGASLGMIPPIIAAQGPTIGGIELAKSVISGLADGGLTSGPSINLIGEGKHQEAVIPLSDAVLSKIGNQMYHATNNNSTIHDNHSSQKIENHYHFGTVVADKYGLKQLTREITNIQISESKRKGG